MTSKSADKLVKKSPVKGAPQVVTLITGASGGIGEALAHRFARAGHSLVLVARSADKLQALAAELAQAHGILAKAYAFDLAQPGAAMQLAAVLQQDQLTPGVLINNAGVLEQGEFAGMSWDQQKKMLDLNISGLTAMLSCFLPGMLERKSGKIMNIASIAAFQPVVGLATYAATKAYVLSLSEALAEECRGSGVTVTALCPGITATNMILGAQKENPALGRIPALLVGQAEDVAEQGYQACMQGEAIRVPGVLNLATTLAARATPKWLVRKISGMLGRSVS